MTREEILKQIEITLEQDEHDYHVLPQYALIPDWFKRYWHLWNLCQMLLEVERRCTC